MLSALVLSATLVTVPPPGRAQTLQTYAPACSAGYSAELLANGDARVMRIIGPELYRGDVTLYGATRRYRAALAAATWSHMPTAFAAETEIAVSAAERIEAVAFHPPGATCDVTAVATPPGIANVTYSATQQIVGADDGPLAAATCDRPYRPAEVIAATEPDMPAMAQQQGITGRVLVLVGLDDTGRVSSARAYRSPSIILNNASINAARHSRFRPAILRCVAVPSTFAFAVDYSLQ